MNNLFVVIGIPNVKAIDNHSTAEGYFIAEMARGKEVGTEQEVLDVAQELDKLYGKDYHYKVARLSFLD